MMKFIIANIAMADIGGMLYMLGLGGGWWGSRRAGGGQLRYVIVVVDRGELIEASMSVRVRASERVSE